MENGELRQWICEAKNIRTGWMWKDRLPNGSLTTDGYAARHPVEFRHWGHARGYVLWGERIDRTDWENWRINYYGK